MGGLAASPALAASFVVNTEADTHDSNPGDGRCADANGECSLRAAIEESNSLTGYPPDDITLPSGTYGLRFGELRVTDSLAINGAGSDTTVIDGGQASRLFVVANSGTDPIVNMSRVTIQNGRGGISSGTGLRIASGVYLYLTDSVVSDHQADVGGVGITNSGVLTLTRTTVRNNLITGGGGGVTGTGAGILNTRSSGSSQVPSVTVIESTISNNQGIRGGGITNAGRLDITNSTISGNKASVGGAIYNAGESAVADIAFSTITNNMAGLVTGEPEPNRRGGGIANFGPARVNIGNSILAGNTDGRTPSDPLFAPDCHAPEIFTFTSFRGNLVGILNANCNLRDTIFGDTSFDQVGSPQDPLDARLALLAENGGVTETHALRPDSPALDRGTGVTSATFFDCPRTDQRGARRPAGAACDVGAFEYGSRVRGHRRRQR